MNLQKRVADALRLAEVGITKLPPAMFEQPGMSSRRVRIFLNELCAFEGCRYLEIGTWKGSTLLAASYGNPGSFVGVDNFSEFGGSLAHFLDNTSPWSKECRHRLIEGDAWVVDPAAVAPINVFFYDGRHDATDQDQAFAHFHPAFADTFVAIVDDWNSRGVRFGTNVALLRYHVLAEWEFLTDVNPDRDGWWNGLYVAVITKTN